MLLNPRDRAKTAFSMHLGLCEFLRLPFGLKTAPKTFQRILNTVVCEFLYKWLVIYIDDCLIWADTQQEALHRYELILKRAVEFGIQFKPTNAVSLLMELDVLGHRVTQEGHFPTQNGVQAIRNFPRPKNATAVKKFLGMCGFFLLTFQIFPTGHYICAVYCERALCFVGNQRMRVSSVISKHH